MSTKNTVFSKMKTALFYIVLHCIPAGFLIGLIGCMAPLVGHAYQDNPARPVLYGILTEDRSADPPEYRIATAKEWRQVRILRGNRYLDIAPNLYLDRGDEIWTGPESAVAIRFPNGSQLYLRSGSHVRIGSIFAFAGELFVRVKGAFQVDTEFVTAGAEGTGWVMKVSPNGNTLCTVLEGRVQVASKRNYWRPLLVTADRQNVTRRRSRYTRMMLAPQRELNKMRYWISQIDRLTHESQPLTKDYQDDRPPPFHFYFNFSPSRQGTDRYPRPEQPPRRPDPEPSHDTVY
ncbi:MAG TPA: FecR family protein [Candidatus Competibacteraceae bacterium]|nr:FecR domain-containing protein [Gammaproteobacteria bacterium]HPF59083.1 FecR family protein [Candidatus Competibacteraceae bacterium]HRX70672.1 FecR family protein [Candidatus Competibacteraceae bacterium]